jgi:MFS family permease
MLSSILKIRDFRNLWIGQSISQMGDAVFYLVFIYMVDHYTKDPERTGQITALQAIPYFLFSLIAGVVVDRRSRKAVMLFSEIASASLLFVFALLLVQRPEPPLIAIFAIAFLLNVVNVFFAPAKSAAIPSLVPARLLLAANSLSSATQNLMNVFGMAISGVLFGILSTRFSLETIFKVVVTLNACSFLASAAFIAKLPPLLPDREEHPHPWEDMKAGVRYIKQNRTVAVLLGLGMLMQLFVAPFFVVYIVVNRQWFGGSYSTLAIFEVCFLVAMVVTSLGLSSANIRRPGIAYIGGLCALGITIAAMAYSRSVFWFAFWNVMAGVALPFAQIPMSTYLQQVVPDEFRGRVNSVLAMAAFGIIPVGSLMAGFMLARLGPVAMFLLMGGGMFLAAFLGALDSSFRTSTIQAGENEDWAESNTD